jgi:hypothetical protein
MTLRTTYTGSLDTKLAEARTAGLAFVAVDNLAAITTGLTAAAGRGQKKFTLNYVASYQPSDLRLLGPLYEAFKTGIEQGLAAENIMGNEVTVKLNTSDNLATTVDLMFQF